MKQHGPWKIRSSQLVYQDQWTSVERDEVVRPDGQDGSYCVVKIKPGVSVLAFDDEGFVYLTNEFHYAIGRDSIEAVSGGIEPDEDPLVTAKRELKEELGIEAALWTNLGVVDPFTSMLLSPTHVFLAQKLKFGEQAQEGTEQIQCVKVSLAEAVSMVHNSHITHGPSCVLILKAYLYLNGILADNSNSP